MEARMARLARQSGDGRSGECSITVGGTPVVPAGSVARVPARRLSRAPAGHVARVPVRSVAHGHAGSGGLIAAILEAAALVGRSIAPTPPIRVRVVRR